MKAFPNPHRTDANGMTLRDYFAAMAMQAYCSRQWTTDADTACVAYSMADAMLLERIK